MTNRTPGLTKGALPFALLLALPLTAAQARPTSKPGTQAIGPKPDDPRQARPAGKTGAQAIGPKPDDPRQAKPAQAVPKADPRKDGIKR
jgi:hypothetical protein